MSSSAPDWQAAGGWEGGKAVEGNNSPFKQTCNWQENSRKLTLPWRQKQPQPTSLDFQKLLNPIRLFLQSTTELIISIININSSYLLLLYISFKHMFFKIL